MVTMGAMEFGVFVRRTRRSLDVKQEDLAKRLGVSQAAVSDIERGDRKTIDEEEVERVVRALCVGIHPPPDPEPLIEQGLREAGILRIRRDPSPEMEHDPDAPGISYTASDLDRLIIRNVGGLDQNDKRLVLELTERMRQAGRERTIGGRRSDAEENPSKPE